MSSIVTVILSSTVGFLCGKARDSAAEKLKDGGLADEKLREIIIQDLTDIKSKLDCLSLKDLDSSYSFLKDGVGLLKLALDSSNEDQKASEGLLDEATSVVNDAAPGILSAALSLPEAVQTLKISSDKRFVSSQDCFKASRERATDAFNNKSLSIKDRIIACKLRAAARILETGLEDPVAAVASCLLFLEELHGLPAVEEMFSVFLKDGLKSRFNKAERLDNIMSVLFINHGLFEFAAKYSSKYPNVFTWPGIELTDRQFNPILNASEISTPSDEKPAQQLHRVLHLPKLSVFCCVAVNSRGEFIVLHRDKLEVINRSTGESKIVTLPDTKGFRTIEAITVDSDDDVYVFISTSKSDVSSSGNKLNNRLLYVFDRNYDMKHRCVLDIFDEDKPIVYTAIAVDKHKNIVMIGSRDSNVYVLDNLGKLKYKFAGGEYMISSFGISNANDIITSHGPVVRVYTVEGNLKRTINVPDGGIFRRGKYHYGLGKVIVCDLEEEFAELKCYSEEGKLEHTVNLRKPSLFMKSFRAARGLFSVRRNSTLFSHPSGLFSVGLNGTVIFI